MAEEIKALGEGQEVSRSRSRGRGERCKKSGPGWHRLSPGERQARKAARMKDKEDRFRQMAESRIREMIPAIAEQVAAFLKEGPKPSAQVPPREPSAAIHLNVSCDHCKAANIQGIRYKCVTCPDYDLCEVCEAAVEHPHSMLKVRCPAMLPPVGQPPFMGHLIGGLKKWLGKNAPREEKQNDEMLGLLIGMGYDREYLIAKMPAWKGLSIEQVIE